MTKLRVTFRNFAKASKDSAWTYLVQDTDDLWTVVKKATSNFFL
jgi:hypothetical protein